ncbi:MAG: hypothetical protein RL357_611 [Pseudomonadota bacterium]
MPPRGLAHLQLVWFSTVMGLTGLALAWSRAAYLMGPSADWVAKGLGTIAALTWVAIAVATVRRAQRFPDALLQDLAHPVRHAFAAAVAVGVLLLVALAVHYGGANVWVDGLWAMAAAAELGITVWVLGRWLHEQRAGDPSMWAGITPVLFIPVVGNVVVPLAGVPLGHLEWSMAQLAIGVFFWPVALVLVLARRAAHSALPPRLLMSWFITVAPPSVIGIVSVILGAPLGWSMGFWGVAVFSLLWATQVVNRAMAVGFHMGFWAISFPLAALTSLTLLLAERGATGWMSAAAMVLLALTSLVIGWLVVSTLRGLRQGTLLVPEPAPPPTPVAG